jgi:tetratricopeptide (TPR) repeat protein
MQSPWAMHSFLKHQGQNSPTRFREDPLYLADQVRNLPGVTLTPLEGKLLDPNFQGEFLFRTWRPLDEDELRRRDSGDAAKRSANTQSLPPSPGESISTPPTAPPASAPSTGPAGRDQDRTRHVTMMSQAYALLINQNYDRAINTYSEALRIDPKVATAFVNRGFAYSKNRDYDRAISDYNEAIRLDPKAAVCKRWWVRLHEKVNNLDRTLSSDGVNDRGCPRGKAPLRQIEGVNQVASPAQP